MLEKDALENYHVGYQQISPLAALCIWRGLLFS